MQLAAMEGDACRNATFIVKEICISSKVDGQVAVDGSCKQLLNNIDYCSFFSSSIVAREERKTAERFCKGEKKRVFVCSKNQNKCSCLNSERAQTDDTAHRTAIGCQQLIEQVGN